MRIADRQTAQFDLRVERVEREITIPPVNPEDEPTTEIQVGWRVSHKDIVGQGLSLQQAMVAFWQQLLGIRRQKRDDLMRLSDDDLVFRSLR